MARPTAMLLRMILLQASVVGAIGSGWLGAASLFGYLTRNSELAFRLPWQLLLIHRRRDRLHLPLVRAREASAG